MDHLCVVGLPREEEQLGLVGTRPRDVWMCLGARWLSNQLTNSQPPVGRESRPTGPLPTTGEVGAFDPVPGAREHCWVGIRCVEDF